jgi:hypothetical protein
MKIGIVVLCTNAYFCLGIRFVKRFMHFYKGGGDITFFLFTDVDPKDYLPDNIHYEYIHTTNKSWVEGTNLKFTSILSLENRDVDFLFYFDADTNIDKDFTEEWFLGESVGGQHYGDQGWMKDKKGFERNPKSKAYVPLDTPLFQVYTYGAFWGGSKEWVMNFCNTMLEWQKIDKAWGFEPGTNDESYSNAYFHYNPPSKLVLCTEFKFLISDKGGIGETRRMDLDVEELKRGLKEAKDKFINIANGKLIVYE